MPINNKPIAVFDFETVSKIAETTEPIEFACIVYNPRTLEPYPDGEFHSDMKCLDESKIDPETLKWHCNLRGKTEDEMLERWRSGPDPELVWKNFANFLKRWNSSKGTSTYNAPIPCGYNIYGFDLLIVDRLCKRYGLVDKNGKQCLFNQFHVIDILHNIIFPWFENTGELTNYKFDTVRDFFGIESKGAHEALYDVQEEAEVYIRFQQFIRKLSKPEKFKGAFRNVN